MSMKELSAEDDNESSSVSEIDSDVIDSDDNVDEAIENKHKKNISIPSTDPAHYYEFANITIGEGSSNVTFGNKSYYKGPVTIKQYNMSENPVLRETSSANQSEDSLPNHEFWGAFTGMMSSGELTWFENFCHEMDRCNFRVISRNEWCAECPKITLTDLELPVNKIIIAHTITPTGTTIFECSSLVRSIQRTHMELYCDISYNFLVGGDGNVYEGRGWNKQGAHTKDHNEKSICIAFIGEFCTGNPSEKQLNAAKNIIGDGLQLGKIAPAFKLFGHRQLNPKTLSPGKILYQIITKWPNWSAE